MYTDPGILSMMIAAIAGAVIAIPAYVMIYRKRIGVWLSAKLHKKNTKRN
jgi:hypothetical protein